nr:hypothetical protein [Flammeovirgaceae bacterium]
PYFNESQKFATLNASIIALKAYNGLKLTNYKVKIIAISNNNRPFEFEYTTKELNHINKASNTIEKFFSILKSHDFDKIPEITFNNEKEGENPFISTGQNVIEKLGEVRRFTIKGWEYHEDALIEEIGERFTIIKCHYQVEHEKEIYDDVAIDIILLNYEEAKIFSVRYKS